MEDITEAISDMSIRDVLESSEISQEEIIFDTKQLIMNSIILHIVSSIKNKIETNLIRVRNMCISSNNSRPIADYMEQLTSYFLERYFINSEYDTDVYMSGNEGRTDHDRIIFKDGNPICVLHIDNKGVQVKEVWKDYTIEKLKDKLIELGHNIDNINRTWDSTIQYIIENNLLNNGIDGQIYTSKKGDRIKYNTNLYSECNTKGDDKNDHPDSNFHMKCSQSNLSGFSSTIKGNEVSYNGLIPTDLNIPHFTFILKHIYSEDHGIHKLVSYAIPHCSIQNKYFSDIQKDIDKVRVAKAIDEFRFNMNDSEGNPYKFLGTDKPRYKVYDILPDINYV